MCALVTRASLHFRHLSPRVGAYLGLSAAYPRPIWGYPRVVSTKTGYKSCCASSRASVAVASAPFHPQRPPEPLLDPPSASCSTCPPTTVLTHPRHASLQGPPAKSSLGDKRRKAPCPIQYHHLTRDSNRPGRRPRPPPTFLPLHCFLRFSRGIPVHPRNRLRPKLRRHLQGSRSPRATPEKCPEEPQATAHPLRHLQSPCTGPRVFPLHVLLAGSSG